MDEDEDNIYSSGGEYSDGSVSSQDDDDLLRNLMGDENEDESSDDDYPIDDEEHLQMTSRDISIEIANEHPDIVERMGLEVEHEEQVALDLFEESCELEKLIKINDVALEENCRKHTHDTYERLQEWKTDEEEKMTQRCVGREMFSLVWSNGLSDILLGC